ncbi:MAG: Occludin/ELL family protein [Cyanobacteriota bacterium]|nr:Occludin/ELL family protein [Cyanobacteriota bacterium]
MLPVLRRSLPGLTAAGAALAAVALAQPLQAGPVLCTTTIEAPPASPDAAPAAPVEVTRCGPITTVPELLTRRAYSWTSPYARGIDLTHQITDLFGIAMGGGDGTRVMGLGFPDQTLVWDGSAIENTTTVLMEDQSPILPLRTADLSGVFNGSVGGSVQPAQAGPGAMSPEPPTSRGLW